jgi:sodium-dependent phosphate cotransporter
MIMGANIGTSVTNIIVALTQASHREQFRKAFACANVHDMFNWLSAFILLITECLTGYLETLTGKMVEHIGDHNSTDVKSPDFLKALTKPVTKVLIQLDKDVLKGWAQNAVEYENATTILRSGCHQHIHGGQSCKYLMAHLGPEGINIGETYIGILLLAISLCMLCGCLIGMVKILNALLGTKVKGIIENVINADIPVRGLGWLTGYLAMVVGAVMTILVQSSSVFTSTLTPLAGAGLVSLERAYPLTLGSNLGTTTTSILASFAAGGENLQAALQISLVHLFFNLTGILLFYPLPCMRWPISIARALGNTTATYRWFALLYLCFMFFIFPVSMFGLSMAGTIPIYIVITFIIITIIFSVTVTNLQTSAPSILPRILKDWSFLPLWLHSLDPWDEMIMAGIGCCCRKKGWDDQQLKEVKINSSSLKETKYLPVTVCNTIEEHIANHGETGGSFSLPSPSHERLNDDNCSTQLLPSLTEQDTSPAGPASFEKLLDNH